MAPRWPVSGMRPRHAATTTPPTSISRCGCTSAGVRHRLRSRTAGLARTETPEGKHSRFAGRRDGIASRTTSITTFGGLKKMLDGPFQSPLVLESVGASLLKSQALRSNPRGLSRSGGDHQSDIGSRSHMDQPAQHSNRPGGELGIEAPDFWAPWPSVEPVMRQSGRLHRLITVRRRQPVRARRLPKTGTTMPRTTNHRNLAHPWPSGSGPAVPQTVVGKRRQQQGSTALPTGSRTGKRA